MASHASSHSSVPLSLATLHGSSALRLLQAHVTFTFFVQSSGFGQAPGWQTDEQRWPHGRFLIHFWPQLITALRRSRISSVAPSTGG
uniref:Putative secreted protein n=1 Tax=Anopheles marajoara TaxID=58244 RepID=A0A2M4CAG2_9DIPT